jgi:hypothetical protein
MSIKIPERLSKFCEKAVFLVLSFLVVVLCLVALEELGPFYGYGLDGTIVQVLAQEISGVHQSMFQYSLGLYVLYAWTWIFVGALLCLMGLLALYLSFFFGLRLKAKHAGRKLRIYLKRVPVLNFALSRFSTVVGLVRETTERFEKKRAKETASEEAPLESKVWKTYMWHMLLLLAVALIVFTYRYVLFPVPQGWDTPYYIYRINDMKRDFTVVTTIERDRPLSLILFYLLTSVSGLMAEQLMVLLTPLIGIVYIVGVYLLVASGTKKKLVALLAAIYTPLTYGTIFLSAGFYSNYLSWAFAMYALTLYIKTMETKERKLKYIATTSIFFALTALTYLYVFVVLTAIVFVHNLLEILTMEEYGGTIKRTFMIYTPFAMLAILKPDSIVDALWLFRLSPNVSSWVYAAGENPYILVLAIIGVIAVLNSKTTTYTRIVISWTIVTSTALAFGMLFYLYRIMPLVPIAVLAAHGTVSISNGIMQHFKSKSMGKPVLPLIFLICFTAMVPHAYIPQSMSTPSSDAMQQIYWIEQHFGFKNYSTIVCFNMVPRRANGLPYSSSYYWGWASLGNIIYDASILYLIQGLADSHGNSYQDLGDKTIIIPDKFYDMKSIDYKATRLISNLGIYEVEVKNVAQVDQIIRNESVWLEDDFEKEEWKPNPPTNINYNYEVTNESSTMNISVTPLCSYNWFDVETRLPATIYPKSELILKVKGNIDSLLFEVNVYSDTGLQRWEAFSKYVTPENYTYLEMGLPPDMPVSRIRLSFYSGATIGIESYVQLDYIALI